MTLNIQRRRDLQRCKQTRVWLNHVEVTDDCFYADGRRGVVRLYAKNSDDHYFVKEGCAAWIEKRGHVRWGLR